MATPANGPNYPYQGGEGVDFDANLSKFGWNFIEKYPNF